MSSGTNQNNDGKLAELKTAYSSQLISLVMRALRQSETVIINLTLTWSSSGPTDYKLFEGRVSCHLPGYSRNRTNEEDHQASLHQE